MRAPRKSVSTQNNRSSQKSLLLDVEGMKCGGCVRSVEQTLLALPSVANASVNLVARTAWLDLKDPEQALDPILKALSDRGFPSKPRSTSPLEGTTLATLMRLMNGGINGVN